MTSTSPSAPTRRVGIAVIDTGVQFRNPWLQAHVRELYYVPQDGVPVRQPVQHHGVWSHCDTRWNELWGHGTEVCDLIQSITPNPDLYVYRLNDLDRAIPGGMAAACRPILGALHHIRDWTGDHPDQNPIDIVNMSIYLSAPPDPNLLYAFDRLLSQLLNQGKVVVMASGNLHPKYPGLTAATLPGSARPGFTVGAADYVGGWQRLPESLTSHHPCCSPVTSCPRPYCGAAGSTRPDPCYVPDAYAYGVIHAGLGRITGSSFSAARATGYFAREIEQGGHPLPLLPALVEALYLQFMTLPKPVGNVPSSHPLRNCIEP